LGLSREIFSIATGSFPAAHTHGSVPLRHPVNRIRRRFAERRDRTISRIKSPFPYRRDRAMCVHHGHERRSPSPRRRLHVRTQNKPRTRESVGAGRRTTTDPTEVVLADEAAASAKKKALANPPKAVAGTQAGKPARRSARSSRVTSKVEKLVCRYCGSDDLAPSFVKRRDARCRACFKQRYGSAWQDTKLRPVRRAKAAK